MKNIIVVCLLMSGIISHSSGQTNIKVSNCQSELNSLQGKRGAIDAEYDLIVNELRSGLFCSQCNRAKSEIEKGGQSFSQHLKDVKGNAVQAPQKAYEQAHKNYLQKFNQWQDDVKSKQNSCNNLQQQAQNDYNRQLQQTAQDNSRKQQQAQDQYKQAQEQNRQAQVQAQQQAQEKIQQQLLEQQASANAALLQQQQNFSQSVNNYAAAQSQANQQRQQDLDKIANQGAVLGQSIQGNAPSITRIAGQSWNDKSIFGDVPSYEDILKSNLQANAEDSRFDQLKDGLSKIGTAFKTNMISRWEKIKDIIPGCIKCVWNAEPIRDYITDAVIEKYELDPWEFAQEITVSRFPRISNFIGSVSNVMPVYDIGVSANELMEQSFTSFDRVMNGADADEESENINNGIENLKHTIYSSLPGISGQLYKANAALKSLFDCGPKK
jgi:hypothetical protein